MESGRGNRSSCCGIDAHQYTDTVLRYAYEGDLLHTHRPAHTHTLASEDTHRESNELMVIFKNPTTVRAITAQISCGIALERQCSPRSRTRTLDLGLPKAK